MTSQTPAELVAEARCAAEEANPDARHESSIYDTALAHLAARVVAERERAERAEELLTLRSLDDGLEETDVVLFWRVPVCEEPYVGTMLDTHFPDDWATHWSPVPQVVEPKEEAGEGVGRG